MIDLIVNADDFGYSDAVNDAIRGASGRGLLSSTSIIANGPSFAGTRGIPSGIACGVHLNISEFAPVRPCRALAPLLNSKGAFFRGIRRNEYVSKALVAAIYAECCAQIEYVRECGIEIAHLDSHHHFHVNPRLLFILRSLQRQYRIPRVRRPWNLWKQERIRTHALRQYGRLWVRGLRFMSQVKVTDFFANFTSIYELQTVLPDGVSVEAMVHPGHATYAGETELLLSSGWEKRPNLFRVVRPSPLVSIAGR